MGLATREGGSPRASLPSGLSKLGRPCKAAFLLLIQKIWINIYSRSTLYFVRKISCATMRNVPTPMTGAAFFSVALAGGLLRREEQHEGESKL